MPIDHPSLLAVVNGVKRHTPKSATVLKTEFVVSLGKKANGSEAPGGIRLYASLFALLTVTSLRFGDVRAARDIWVTKSALGGISINSRDNAGALMNWDTPSAGLVSPKTERYVPLWRHWARVGPGSGMFRASFPHVNSG